MQGKWADVFVLLDLYGPRVLVSEPAGIIGIGGDLKYDFLLKMLGNYHSLSTQVRIPILCEIETVPLTL